MHRVACNTEKVFLVRLVLKKSKDGHCSDVNFQK